MELKKPNIVLLTLDGVRVDHLSFSGYGRKTTPFLDSLASEGVRFSHAYSTGPGSSVSFIGMFTSTYPLDHGGFSFVDRPRVMFTEALQEAGYATVGVHSSPYLSDYFGYNRGWSVFRYLTHFKFKGGATMSPGLRRGTLKSKILKKNAAGQKWLAQKLPFLRAPVKFAEKFVLMFRKILKDFVQFTPAFFIAEDINKEMVKVLETAPGRPIFIWAHYLDAHAPYGLFYRSRPGIWNKFKYYAADLLAFLFGEIPSLNRFFMPLYMNVYDDSIKYIDESIKHLFDSLRAKGILDDAVVIVHADHGEEFMEHGSFGHMQKLFNVNVHVPLLVHSPSRFVPRVIERPVSLLDVAPTILGLAGAPIPESYKGKDVFRDEDRDVVSQASESAGDLSEAEFTGITIIRDGYKFIEWKGQKFLYSLKDEAEKNNLYDSRRDIAEDLERRAKAYAPELSA